MGWRMGWSNCFLDVFGRIEQLKAQVCISFFISSFRVFWLYVIVEILFVNGFRGALDA